MRLQIAGKPWTVEFLRLEPYEKLYGKDSVAITTHSSNRIDFCLDYLCKATVRHEIMHAFSAMIGVRSLNLNREQSEEYYCEVYGEHGDAMERMVRDILAKGRKRKRSKKR